MTGLPSPRTERRANLSDLLPLIIVAAVATALTGSASAETLAAERPSHRYLVERSFPPGALDGLDEAGKRQVNARNAELGVRWLHSYANADRTRTLCVYEGPSEAAVREAAARNALPVDRVTEIPLDLDPGPHAAPSGTDRRFLIERTFPAGALDGLDELGKRSVHAVNAALQVDWVRSYASSDLTRTFCVYRGPSEEAVREAAARNGLPVDSVTEVPVDLLPAGPR